VLSREVNKIMLIAQNNFWANSNGKISIRLLTSSPKFDLQIKVTCSQ